MTLPNPPSQLTVPSKNSHPPLDASPILSPAHWVYSNEEASASRPHQSTTHSQTRRSSQTPPLPLHLPLSRRREDGFTERPRRRQSSNVQRYERRGHAFSGPSLGHADFVAEHGSTSGLAAAESRRMGAGTRRAGSCGEITSMMRFTIVVLVCIDTH